MIAAFFDLDNTILSTSSGRLWIRYLRQTRRLSRRQEAAIWGWIGLYALGLLDFPHLMVRVMAGATGQDEAETWALCRRWFEELVRGYVAEGARAAIDRHRAEGHHVAIVTASTPYAAGPVATHLGLGSAYLATQLEVRAGRFTGKLIEPACHGAGKVYWVDRYAAELDIDVANSFFYTDSINDLPLLEHVGHPVAVNPDRKLARLARQRGWPTVSFY